MYWQALGEVETSYVLAPRIIDSENKVVSAYDTIPATGRYPTPMWIPGVRFAERHVMPPIADHAAPGVARLVLDVYPFGAAETSPGFRIEGAEISAPIFLSSGKISAPQATRRSGDAPLAVFGSLGELTAAWVIARNEKMIAVALDWRARQPDGEAYQVFAHLVDEEGRLIAQADGPPRSGTFPTSIWDSDDVIRGIRRFYFPDEEGLPAGRYRVYVGFYRLDDGVRLPAMRANGNRWPDDRVIAVVIDIP